MRRFVALAALLAWTAAAGAVDRWSRPARGLRYLRRVTVAGNVSTTVHALYVDLCDPAIELRATAPNEGRRTAGQWARLVGAAAAINGDYFDMARYVPLGPARGAGRTWTIARAEYRDAVFVAAAGGRVAVLDAPEVRADGARIPPAWTEAVAVRERVLVAGVVRESPQIAHDGTRHPRTAVGLTADGHTALFVVVDGRGENSGGATTRELGVILRDLGAWEGMKLDGGGSSTLFIRGRGDVNQPSDGYPRVVATHLGVMVRRDVPASAPSRCPRDAP
jgi:exopolysaccharide biosynthesis protein